jgi:hypothetical protein
MRSSTGLRRAARVVLSMLAVSALVATAVGTAGCTGWPFGKQVVVIPGHQPSTPGSRTTTEPLAATHTRPTPPTDTKPLASATPEDAMRAWYLAWFAGDMDAAKRTSTESWASQIDENTFEGGDVTDYKVLGSEGAAGTIAFYISETREDVPGKTPMTVLVSANDACDGYLVKGYDTTQPGDKPASPPSPEPAAAVNMQDAQYTVTQTLRDLQSDKAAEAQVLATPRFVKANPSWFAPASGALVDFSIARVVRRHNVWVVQMAEKWQGETSTLYANYVVDNVNGDAKIDRVQGWY